MIGKLFLFFIILPLADMYLLLRVGTAIGTMNTLVLVIGTGLLGGLLYRMQSRANMQQLAAAIQSGVIPDIEMVDRVLITIGAILLVTPGIITDLAGFITLIPFTRPLVRTGIKAWLRRKVDQGTIQIQTV